MNSYLKSQKGSSTILISMLLVTLVVFGLLSLTTTASELKLAGRSAKTNEAFYSLDSEGVRFLYDIKALIEQAKKDSVEISASFYDLFETLLNNNFEGLVYEINTVKPDMSFINLRRTVILEDGDLRRYLNITLNITDPRGKSVNEACEVIEWRLWQEPFDYKNTIDLWEGIPQ